jgi:hypothetical protein
MTSDLLLLSIPPLILLVAMLGIRRYSRLNLARQVGGFVIVYATLAAGMTGALDAPVAVFLGAIGGTLVGQAYEAEKQRAAERRRAVGIGDDRGMSVGARS